MLTDEEIAKKREQLQRELEKENEPNLMKDKRLEKARQIEAERRNILMPLFKDEVGRDMTEEEFLRYCKDFNEFPKNRKEAELYEKGFNLYAWIKVNIKNG